jgi:dimethylargininase
LCTDDRVLLGLSARTNAQGAEDLKTLVSSSRLSRFYRREIHFKTESSLLNSDCAVAPAL